MFTEDKSTVFILGAGASWHYGYPTGEQLVREARAKAEILASYYDYSAKNGNPNIPKFLRGEGEEVRPWWRRAHETAARLKLGLEVANPLVIDYFLGLNPDLQDVGRLIIAWTILDRERKSGGGSNINRSEQTTEDDWCRFVTHALTLRCVESSDLRKNKVSFVTFNYDGSLERRLENSLRQIQILHEKEIKNFLSGSRIVHVYGKLGTVAHRTLKWTVQDTDPHTLGDMGHRAGFHTDFCSLLEAIHDAAANIRVIDPHNKDDDSESILIARKQISVTTPTFSQS